MPQRPPGGVRPATQGVLGAEYHLKRTWYSGLPYSLSNSATNAWLSSWDQPVIRGDMETLMNNASSPVSEWVRTSG